MAIRSKLPAGASRTGGRVLAVATRVLSVVQPADKPLHPRGQVVTGRLRRWGVDAGWTGCTWLDEPGDDPVTVRLSRAVGLPRALPDVHGLALRVETPDGRADLLFATTGWSGIARFVFVPRLTPHHPMTTLLPYRTPRGAVLLGLRPVRENGYELVVASPRGGWRAVGALDLSAHPATDEDVAFDPVRWQVPGLAQYPAVVRLREPAYATARRSRS